MRKKIIASFAVLFILLLSGSGLSILSLYRTTDDLQSVINLHKVEIIRQDLVISAQTVQSHLYSFGTSFGPELDVIVRNVIELDNAAQKCLKCHHRDEIKVRLEEVVSLVDHYQDSLSLLIVTSADKDRVERLRLVSIGIGTTLLDRTQQMAAIAGARLNEHTVNSLREIDRSRNILILTLIASFFIAIGIAVTMTRQITEPIYELVDATRRIIKGDLGYTTQYRGVGEFAELVKSFNEMSLTLDMSNKKVHHHINNLSNLYSVTLTFHSLTSETDIYRELARGVADLVGAEQAGLMLLEGEEFVHQYPAAGLDLAAARRIRFPRKTLLSLYDPTSRRAFVRNGGLDGLPTSEVDASLNVRNIMYVWVRQKGEITGAIRSANKRGSDFTHDDVHPLAILANNVSVALENARLYESLRTQMHELKNAQEQLIQAAKLAAIGELASNVAHELNNPLTTVLGYAELMKEEKDVNNLVADLEVIQRECLRAKEIIRQLLEFARKRPLQRKQLHLNTVISDLISMAGVQKKSSAVEIKTDFGSEDLIHGDENQLKQVFINIINNALYAIGETGTLHVSTRADNERVYIKFEDTGPGIPEKDLHKVFDPFFSTKKDKGTGLGLSVSYQIIKSHDGTIEVDSPAGKGAIFTVALPMG